MDTKNQKKNSPCDNVLKRTFNHVDPDSSSDEEIIVDHADSWPRFLLMKSKTEERSLAKLSPFAIQKGIEGIAGTPTSVRKLRSGEILVEVNKRPHSDNLLRATTFVNCPVAVCAHKTLNNRKGVIRSIDLKDCDEQEVIEELKSQGVVDAKRISVKRNGSVVRTGTLILTFALPSLPPCVKCGYLSVRVDPYIPNPLRCFNCQQFGHHRNNCRRRAVCPKCGSLDHNEASCTGTPQCVNCKGAHSAFSRDCPEWVREKEIQKIKCTNNISFMEAKKIVSVSRPETTYAQVVKENTQVVKKPKVTSVGCQTTTTWLFSEKYSQLEEAGQTAPSGQSAPASTTTAVNTNPEVCGQLGNKSATKIVRPGGSRPVAPPKAQCVVGTKGKISTTTTTTNKSQKPKVSGREKKGNGIHQMRIDRVELEIHAGEESMDFVPDSMPP